VPIIYDPPAGDHQLGNPVDTWGCDYLFASHPPMVELLASIRSDPMLRGHPSRGTTPTTLAIQMDAQVATVLYEKLGDLIRKMGWQRQVSGGRPI
jgi:hypothetical protein